MVTRGIQAHEKPEVLTEGNEVVINFNIKEKVTEDGVVYIYDQIKCGLSLDAALNYWYKVIIGDLESDSTTIETSKQSLIDYFTIVGSSDVSVEVATILEAKYAVLRAKEYPAVEEYLDAVVKGDEAAVEAYRQKCLAIKAKYPKR